MSNKPSIISFIYDLMLAFKIISKEFVKEYSSPDKGTYLTKFFYETTFLNKYKIKKTNLLKYFQPFKDRFDDYDNIIYFSNAEEYLIYFYITYILSKEEINNTLFLCANKYHASLLEIFCPDTECELLKINEYFPLNYRITMQFNQDKNKVQSLEIINLNPLNKKIQNSICNSPIDSNHYFEEFLKLLSVEKENIRFNDLIIPKYIQENVIEKVRKLKLNLDKFVFVAPESNYSKKYDDEFWTNLCNSLKNEGYDIFLYKNERNTTVKKCTYKTCKLDVAEALALANLSKGVISLRSGFCEMCLQINAPLFCLYNDFKDTLLEDGIDVYSAFYGFALNKLPFVDTKKLFEINMFEESNSDVIKCISDNLLKD